jgi:acyl-CoA reductase-like NAD-dependent aldehyde dehydrogenase
MNQHSLPGTIPNWINGEACAAKSGETFDKLSPDTGRKLCGVARSGSQDVQNAIQGARKAQAAWAEFTHCPSHAQASKGDC